MSTSVWRSLSVALVVAMVAACTTTPQPNVDHVPSPTVTVQQYDLDCSSPADGGGRTFSDDEWISLSAELEDAAAKHRLPLIDLCTDDSRRVVAILIEVHESDWIVGEVEAHLVPLADRFSDHIRVVYRPFGEIVPLPLFT